MTKSEYQQLVEFIAPRFDRIDRRFEKVDERFDEIDRRFEKVDERITKVEVLFEESRHRIEIVAEGVTGLRAEMYAGFEALRSEMAEGFELQGNAIRDVSTRVQRLEAVLK